MFSKALPSPPQVLRGCSKSPGSSLSGAVRDCNANQSAAGPLDRMRQQFDEQGASVSPIHGSHKVSCLCLLRQLAVGFSQMSGDDDLIWCFASQEGAQPDAGAPTANRERNAGHTCSSEDLPSQNHPEGQEGDAGRKSSGSGSSERSLTPGPSDDIPVSKVEDRDSPRTSGEEEGVFASSKGWFDALAGENRSKKQTAGSGFFVHGLAGASLPWRLSRSTRVIPRAVASAPSSPRKEAFQSEDRIEADGQALAGPKRAPGDPVIPCSEAEPAPAGDGLLCEFQSQIEQRIARPKGRSTDPNHQVTSSGDSEGQPHEAAEPTLAYESEQDAAVLPDADEHDGSLQWPMALLDMSQEYCEPVSSLNDARHVREPSEQLHTPPGSIPTGDRSSIPTAGVEVKHVGRNEEQGEDGSRAERTEQAFVKVEDGRESAGTPIKLSEQTGSHPDEEATKMPSAGQSENASDCNDRTASETFSATEPKHSEASSATKSHEKPQQGTDAEPRAEDLQKQAAAGGTERSPRVGVGAFEFPCESGGGAKSWLPVGGRHRDDGDFPDQACSEPREPATFQTIQHKALRWRRHRLASLRSQQSTSSLKERSERPPDDGCHVDLKGLSRKLPSSSGVDSDFAPFEGVGLT